ncbi:MAG: NDP-hexose 2,3-dehydratase family protein, partial [Lachnospiraceae bacterium]|nr:NDP-hexose 2,3-dehydratase family protein [Lachnospiraceae bacterium]
RDAGIIRNADGSFFQIGGVRLLRDGKTEKEQPIIIQNEIGFLGIICTKINGVWHYLMQAKIEPGNVNVVQLSPTIQATKSNFERKHGGKSPLFLDYFLKMQPDHILVDQIQSEQSSRFLCKRNRNVLLMVDEELEETENHRWMTLKQIKEWMHRENLINMDTRTVLSCIPYVLLGEEGDVPFSNRPYFERSAQSIDRRTIVELYKEMNDYKMFCREPVQHVPLHELKDWRMLPDEVSHKSFYPFKVIYCDVEINGREVRHWRQPLIAANGSATIGLICCDDNGVLKFLVKPRAEIGCLDAIELGPTIQQDAGANAEEDAITKLFYRKLAAKEGILADIMLSEEGGRFYQEQNRNIIIQADREELEDLPKGYVLSDYGTLNLLTQINNCLNIQLRNLLSLLEI